MQRLLKLFVIALLYFCFTGCAVIFGGSKYHAKVITDNEDAKIEYKGGYRGTGIASFRAKRKDANKFEVTLRKAGCEPFTKTYTSRTFRGWSFVGTLLMWTGLIPGTPIPVPWGIVVDGSTGAWWKPDVDEGGVSKESYKRFTYNIEYPNCKSNQESIPPPPPPKSKADKLKEVKKLLDDGILNQEEFEKEKAKILEQE